MRFNVFLIYLNNLTTEASMVQIYNLRNTKYADITNPELLGLKNKFSLKKQSDQQRISDQIGSALSGFATRIKTKET